MNAVMLWPALAVAGIAVLGCSIAASRSPGDGQDFAQVERGRYLATAADCAACHDDPVEHRPFAGGLAIETPFGAVMAPNITPDRDTGIGAWSDAEFDAVLRRGRLPDGKRVYPAMPFPYYTKLSAADVRAIRAYLGTVPAVHHGVVSDQLPFPFSVRASMLVWDGLYFSPGQFEPDAAKSADWNRGAFLVKGPGHCGACHTPKTLLGGDKAGAELQGYEIQGWFAPDITDSQGSGVGAWSVADIVEYLRAGHNRFAAASGPMADEVSNSSSHWSAEDLADVAAYLKDQGAESAQQTHAGPARQPAPDDPTMAAGAAIYGDLCASCHRSDGAGIAYLIPNLSASSSVASRDPATLIRVVLLGANSVATREEPTAPAMPSFAWQLSDAQVAAVATYIRNTWNHSAAGVTERQVHEARTKLLAAGR